MEIPDQVVRAYCKAALRSTPPPPPPPLAGRGAGAGMAPAPRTLPAASAPTPNLVVGIVCDVTTGTGAAP